jgi:hypothetical protein
MKHTATVWHAVIRDEHGVLRCMDPGCPFNNRRPGADGKRDLRYHRADDLRPAGATPSTRRDGPDRRKPAVVTVQAAPADRSDDQSGD